MTDRDNTSLPIGVFDSGVGGLTVLKAIRAALPSENLIYLGDTARLPYGTKSPASIARYATQASAKLLGHNIKMLVVACNTASAVALDALQEQMAPVPVIGVVEPGAVAAVAARPGGSHLVLATEATVRLGAYSRAITARDPAANVREQACELLVACGVIWMTLKTMHSLRIASFSAARTFRYCATLYRPLLVTLSRSSIRRVRQLLSYVKSWVPGANLPMVTSRAHCDCWQPTESLDSLALAVASWVNR